MYFPTISLTLPLLFATLTHSIPLDLDLDDASPAFPAAFSKRALTCASRSCPAAEAQSAGSPSCQKFNRGCAECIANPTGNTNRPFICSGSFQDPNDDFNADDAAELNDVTGYVDQRENGGVPVDGGLNPNVGTSTGKENQDPSLLGMFGGMTVGSAGKELKGTKDEPTVADPHCEFCS